MSPVHSCLISRFSLKAIFHIRIFFFPRIILFIIVPRSFLRVFMLFGVFYRDTQVHLRVAGPLWPFSSTRPEVQDYEWRSALSCLLRHIWRHSRSSYYYHFAHGSRCFPEARSFLIFYFNFVQGFHLFVACCVAIDAIDVMTRLTSWRLSFLSFRRFVCDASTKLISLLCVVSNCREWLCHSQKSP